MTIREISMPTSKYNIKCPYAMTPEFVVIHNTANDASAVNEIKYMQSNDKEVSFHYAVDDNEAVQGVPLSRNAWHAGDGGNGKGNRKGIAIEICYSKSGGDRFTKAEQNAAELTATLLTKYGWDISHVKKHQDFSGKYCLPIDETELLTPDGWTNLGKLKVGDTVAQYNNGKIEFTEVEHVIEPHVAKVVKARRIEATLDHDMLVTTQKCNEERKLKWADVLDKHMLYVPVGGIYETEGLPISDDYIRFLVWVQADGHYMRRKSKRTGIVHDIGVEFHFAKIRKVNRVCEILTSIGMNYTYRQRTNGTYVIRIFDSKLIETVEEYLNNKMFSWKLLELSQAQRLVLLNEIIRADGSETNRSYFSTKEQNYDVVAALSALSNIRCYRTTTGNSTAMIFSGKHLTVNGKITQKEERETMVSCVSVSSGNILIRQYGQPKVVGNCPHRTLDLGWQRFLDIVSAELSKTSKTSTTANKTYKDSYEVSGITITRAKNFAIRYLDKDKRRGCAARYINAGFFAVYRSENSNTTFTLPVGNLACDITSIPTAAEKYLTKHVYGQHLVYSVADNASSQFKGKQVSTLLVDYQGNAKIERVSAVPSGCQYAISGLPVIINSQPVTWAYVKAEGWDDSTTYNTSRNLVGLRNGDIWVLTAKTATSNYITSQELWNKLKDEGFTDVIALDGGGSYIRVENCRRRSTGGSRAINNIIVF